MKKRLVIIPAAGLATRLMPMSASMSKAMVPVAGRPILSHIIESIKEHVDHIIVVHGSHNDIPNFLRKKDYHTVSWCMQDEKYKGPLGAVYSGLEYFDTHNRYNKEDYNLTIWLGDTLLDNPRKISNIFNSGQTENSVYAVSKVPDWSRWCLVKKDEMDILRFIDKPKNNPDTDLALVGVYNLNYNLDDLIGIAHDAVIFNEEEEISDLLGAFGGYPGKRVLHDVTDSWVDCGDLPSLYTANSRMISGNARGHNFIRIKDGVVYKKSSNHEAETGWYEKISNEPIEIRALVPQYYGKTDFDEYAIELCSGQTLQELVLYHNISRKDVWKNIINSVLDKVHIMHSSKMKNVLLFPKDKIKNDFMFNQNITNRLSNITFGRYDTVLNQFEYTLIIDFLKETQELLTKSYTTTCDVIHGDLHFGNIIFDAGTNKVKLIDPRGTWGLNNNTTEGNALYDLAKFYQSFITQYCHISSDEYVVSDEELKVYEMLEEITDENLSKVYSQEDIKLIKRYSILLLASAIPCHSDNSKRQHIMKNTALDLIKSGKY